MVAETMPLLCPLSGTQSSPWVLNKYLLSEQVIDFVYKVPSVLVQI